MTEKFVEYDVKQNKEKILFRTQCRLTQLVTCMLVHAVQLIAN